MAMSKADWEEVKERLERFWALVYLDCDGYKLALMLQRVGTYKNKISFYVDGKFQGKWILQDCEERRRFFQPRKIYAWGKKEMRIDLDKTALAYSMFWSSFRALKAHLIRNNKEITLIRENADAEAIQAAIPADISGDTTGAGHVLQ